MSLSSYGFSTQKELSGQGAINNIISRTNNNCCKQYNLIMMDIDMPEKNGHQTTIEI